MFFLEITHLLPPPPSNPIFLFLSLHKILAASAFVLGPHVGEVFETERVCHPPDTCIVEVGPAIEKCYHKASVIPLPARSRDSDHISKPGEPC